MKVQKVETWMGVPLTEKKCHILNRCIKKFSFWLEPACKNIFWQIKGNTVCILFKPNSYGFFLSG